MDKLNIDFQSLFPYVIDAFCHVCGEEYRPMISKKLKNTVIIFYHDIEGLDDYVDYLKSCKARELSIQFLEEIGYNVQKHKKNNYTESLDENIKEILESYIDSPFLGFCKNPDFWSPLRAFNSNNNNDPKILLKRKLKLINHLLGNNHEKITDENFNAFTKTKEYSELLKRIEQLNLVYERLLAEYNDWARKLLPYEKYVEYEKKRKESILQKKKNELFEDIFYKLPSLVKENIVSKTRKEQQDAILGQFDISSTSTIESFSPEQMKKLMSPEVNIWAKYWIVKPQINYLKNLDIAIPNECTLDHVTEENIMKCLNFLNQDSIKKYIPSEELINYTLQAREKKYEEALKEYYTTRKDFKDIIELFDNNPNNFEAVYDKIKNKRVCVLGHGGTNDNNEFISIMFYTIRKDDGGLLFHVFMHEMGHVIDQSQNGIGFEIWDDFNENSIKNPYDKDYRKYEKFNETLNDIFIMEANEFLQNQGIYLIEPQKYTSLNASDHNTALITKNLLYPLVQKFRNQVIKAKVYAKPEELIKYIGKDNFENLVDAVNKVDYLSRNGVISKIENFKEDTMVLEYFEQVERVKQIYINIDNFYSSNFGTLSPENYDYSEKHR